jgi:hypothetical protein
MTITPPSPLDQAKKNFFVLASFVRTREQKETFEKLYKLAEEDPELFVKFFPSANGEECVRVQKQIKKEAEAERIELENKLMAEGMSREELDKLLNE